MKRFLRTITLTLAALMLLLALASCKDKGDDAIEQPESDVVSDTDAETEVDYYADIPDGSYNGYEFKIMVTAHNWASYDMIGGVGTGAFNKEIYERNKFVEDKLGITISQNTGDGATLDTLIQKQVMSGGEDVYDAYWHAAGRINILSLQGCMFDLRQMSGLNLGKPWWYTDFMDDIHISEKRYSAFGSINTIYHGAFGLCAFNKDMLEIIDPTADLYEVYESGEWTWEKMFNYMKLASAELGGDGGRKAGDDQFGLAIHSNTLINFLLTADEMIVEKGADGIPTYVGADVGYINAWEYIVDNFSNPNYTIAPNITEGYSEYSAKKGSYITAFNEGRALFLLQGAGAFARTANATIPYGMIGYPKPDVDSEYISPVYFGLSGMCVVSNCPDAERTGVILENLAAYSYEKVDKNYIESVLYYKYAKDAKATEVISKVFKMGKVDVAWVYSWGKIGGTLTDAFAKRNRDVVSLFESKKSAITGDMQKTIIFLSR